MSSVIKRDGREVPFEKDRVVNAIKRANSSVSQHKRLKVSEIQVIADYIENKSNRARHALSVEEIQDLVISEIHKLDKEELEKAYITYRYQKAIDRQTTSDDDYIMTVVNCNNEDVKQENSNKNPTVISVQRDYIAGEVSKRLAKRRLLTEDIVKAHDAGEIHFHDLDYEIQTMLNCCLINLEDMLQNGTVISGTMIEKPHSFSTACNVTTQIIAQVASNQYGGQSITLSHLAPFVDISRQKIRTQVKDELAMTGQSTNASVIETITKVRLANEIKRGVQMIQYQVITLMTTNGQAPFVTVYMYLDEVPEGQTREDLALIIEEVLRQRIQGIKNEKGIWITPAFPKLIYTLDEDNIHEDSKYYYLTELAAKCTAKRMVPDYISAKIMKELKIDKTSNGAVYPCMGCRSFLTPDRTTENYAKALNYNPNLGKYYGRFNQGVVTINLPDVACASNGDFDKFWEILEERLELCHKALRIRHDHLLGTLSDVSPIHWQFGALARLKKGETIDELLYHGYSTISLGYAGISEMCVRMFGKSHHQSEEAKNFALAVMHSLNDHCTKWKTEEDIDYSVYGTPLESTTYKFAKALQKKYGSIPGVSDRNYVTNSYHIHVTEDVNAFDKLTFESDFQKLSPGGAISYVEVPNMQDNIPAVLTVIKHIYNTILYAELNTKSDYCMKCSFDGEIVIEEDKNKKLFWKCPNCGNTDQTLMSVARRTCGYIGSQFWNQGRTQEIKDRVLHL